jgi:hypothetical protein
MKEILNQDDDDDVDDLLYIRGTIDRLHSFLSANTCKIHETWTNTLLCCRLHGERGPKKGRKESSTTAAVPLGTTGMILLWMGHVS